MKSPLSLTALVQICVTAVLVFGVLFYFSDEILNGFTKKSEINKTETNTMEAATSSGVTEANIPASATEISPVESNAPLPALEKTGEQNTITQASESQTLPPTEKKVISGIGAYEVFKTNLSTCTETLYTDFDDTALFVAILLGIGGFEHSSEITNNSNGSCRLVQKTVTSDGISASTDPKDIMGSMSCDIDMEALQGERHVSILEDLSKLHGIRYMPLMLAKLNNAAKDKELSPTLRQDFEDYKKQINELVSSPEYKKLVKDAEEVLNNEAISCSD